MINTILYVVYAIACVSLIVLVLLQHGKGADAGAAFGSGASGTVFGAAGSANFLTKSTKYMAIIFFAIAMTMMFFQGKIDGSKSSAIKVEETTNVNVQVPQANVAPTKIDAPAVNTVPPADANKPVETEKK